MLPPAGTPIPSASDGLFGLGGVGDPCILCRRCRLGPSSSRFSFPGGVGEAAATAAPWNKSLLSRLRFVCASSGADEGYVRAEYTGAGGLAMALVLPVLGYSGVGVCSSTACPGMWKALMARCSRPAIWFVVVRLMGLRVSIVGFRRRARAHGQRSMGCVPGRYAFTVSFYGGSFQSLCAMVFLLTLVSTLLSSLVGSPAEDGEGRRRTADGRVAEDFLDLCVIFLFFRVFCANMGGQLCLLYCSRSFLYVYGVMYAFLV